MDDTLSLKTEFIIPADDLPPPSINVIPDDLNPHISKLWLSCWDEPSLQAIFGRTLMIDYDSFSAIVVHWIPNTSITHRPYGHRHSHLALTECPGCSLDDASILHSQHLRQSNRMKYSCQFFMN